MAGERELIWGETPTAAQWRSADDSASGNFVVAEDMDGGTVLLEYDTAANEWVSRGPVNLSGEDVTNVGALDAASISTGGLSFVEGFAVEEDDNSPLTGSASQSHSISLSNSYDIIVVDIAEIENELGSVQDIGVRVNGDSGSNYNWNDLTNSRTTGDTSWKLTSIGTGNSRTMFGQLLIKGSSIGRMLMTADITASTNNTPTVGGDNSNLSNETLDSIEILGTGGDIAVDARVLGVSI